MQFSLPLPEIFRGNCDVSSFKDMDDDEISIKLQSRNEWYCIVDGDHT